MRAEFEKEGNAHQYQDASRSKTRTGYFQLSGYKKIRQHVLLNQEPRYFIVEKILYITTKLDLSRVHFNVKFPSINPSIFAENSESGKSLNACASTIQLTTYSVSVSFLSQSWSLSVSVLYSLRSYNTFLYLSIYFCKWVY